MSTKTYEIRPNQSIELLKELHILTRDGKMNQDSRRKLKQVYHLFQFIEPLLADVERDKGGVTLVDHGAGKSYLGFILYDLFFKARPLAGSHIYGIETREALVVRSTELAERLGFGGMSFLNLSVADSIASPQLPETVDVVTALHACDTATDDAIRFALAKRARYIVLVPCCQAEVAGVLRKNKGKALSSRFDVRRRRSSATDRAITRRSLRGSRRATRARRDIRCDNRYSRPSSKTRARSPRRPACPSRTAAGCGRRTPCCR